MVKRTYQPKKGKKLKTRGFRSRIKTQAGKKMLKRRIAKGRKRIAL